MYVDGVATVPALTYTFDKGEHTVKFVFAEKLTGLGSLFSRIPRVTSVDLSALRFEEDLYMGYAFQKSSALAEVKLPYIANSAQVSMLSCFRESDWKEELRLSARNKINVSHLTFLCVYSDFTSLDLSFLDIKGVNKSNITNPFNSCSYLDYIDPFWNWKAGDFYFPVAIIKNVHDLIDRSMDLADGAEARTLTLRTTTKANWEASEYYQTDLELLVTKGITIA